MSIHQPETLLSHCGGVKCSYGDLHYGGVLCDGVRAYVGE
jgi:hypothetical protein